MKITRINESSSYIPIEFAVKTKYSINNIYMQILNVSQFIQNVDMSEIYVIIKSAIL